MKKETLFALFLGVAFGVIVSLIMISRTKDRQMGKTTPLTSGKKSSVAITNDVQTQSFTISEPQEKQIIVTNSVIIKGSASKNDLLIVQSPIKDLAYQLENDNFEVKMPLALGENVISLTIYPNNSQGHMQQKLLRVYYLDEQ